MIGSHVALRRIDAGSMIVNTETTNLNTDSLSDTIKVFFHNPLDEVPVFLEVGITSWANTN